MPAGSVAASPPLPSFLLSLPSSPLFFIPPATVAHLTGVAAGHQPRRRPQATFPSHPLILPHPSPGLSMHGDPRPPLCMCGRGPLASPPAGCTPLPPSPSTSNPLPEHLLPPYRPDPLHLPPTASPCTSRCCVEPQPPPPQRVAPLAAPFGGIISFGLSPPHQDILLLVPHPSQQHHVIA